MEQKNEKFRPRRVQKDQDDLSTVESLQKAVASEIEKSNLLQSSISDWMRILNDLNNGLQDNTAANEEWQTKYENQRLHNNSLKQQVTALTSEVRHIKNVLEKVRRQAPATDRMTRVEQQTHLRQLERETQNLKSFEKMYERKLDDTSREYQKIKEDIDTIRKDVWFSQKDKIRLQEEKDKKAFTSLTKERGQGQSQDPVLIDITPQSKNGLFNESRFNKSLPTIAKTGQKKLSVCPYNQQKLPQNVHAENCLPNISKNVMNKNVDSVISKKPTKSKSKLSKVPAKELPVIQCARYQTKTGLSEQEKPRNRKNIIKQIKTEKIHATELTPLPKNTEHQASGFADSQQTRHGHFIMDTKKDKQQMKQMIDISEKDYNSSRMTKVEAYNSVKLFPQIKEQNRIMTASTKKEETKLSKIDLSNKVEIEQMEENAKPKNDFEILGLNCDIENISKTDVVTSPIEIPKDKSIIDRLSSDTLNNPKKKQTFTLQTSMNKGKLYETERKSKIPQSIGELPSLKDKHHPKDSQHQVTTVLKSVNNLQKGQSPPCNTKESSFLCKENQGKVIETKPRLQESPFNNYTPFTKETRKAAGTKPSREGKVPMGSENILMTAPIPDVIKVKANGNENVRSCYECKDNFHRNRNRGGRSTTSKIILKTDKENLVCAEKYLRSEDVQRKSQTLTENAKFTMGKAKGASSHKIHNKKESSEQERAEEKQNLPGHVTKWKERQKAMSINRNDRERDWWYNKVSPPPVTMSLEAEASLKSLLKYRSSPCLRSEKSVNCKSVSFHEVPQVFMRSPSVESTPEPPPPVVQSNSEDDW